MRKARFPLLLVIMVLLIPASAFAQKSASANKSWNSFWTQFSFAVNKKSKPAIKRLMAAEKDFFSGGGMEDRNGWLAMVEQYKLWGNLQRAVKGGTKSYDYEGKPGRLTKDNTLVFAFIGGQWRFMGPMGD